MLNPHLGTTSAQKDSWCMLSNPHNRCSTAAEQML
jgi:hypothetical protein